MYITSSKMVVLETTNHIYNFTILKVGLAATATTTTPSPIFPAGWCLTVALNLGPAFGVSAHHIDIDRTAQ
jgi:hypothetical protein